jgi:putative ABC transport system permease protein
MEMLEHFKIAWKSLTANKLRSGLTMLGIAIGNGSVIALVGVGQGAQQLAAQQFEALGPNVLFVNVARSMRRTITNARPLVLADAEAIARDVPTIKEVSPEIHSQQLISYKQNSFNNSTVGVTPSYLIVRNFEIIKGRFINEVDIRRNNRVVVLGFQLSRQLFGQENPLGQQVRIRNLSFRVVGILAPKGSLFGSNQDDQALVPITTMDNQLRGWRTSYGIPVSLISVLAKDQESIDAAEFQIKNLIHLRHQVTEKGYVTVNPQTGVIEMATKTNEGLTRMLAAIGSISLLVGGIGVMNIMLVSVTERKQEIGLRKAVGAREKDILIQFLIEAVILATIGGMSGIIISVGGMMIAGTISSLSTSISLTAIVLGVGVSGSIGLFFGVVPAQRAAKLDPIVALRSS